MGLTAQAMQGRICAGCGRPLSRYNVGDYCGPCSWPGEHDAQDMTADIGARLRALRRRRGMTLEVLAGLSGRSAAYLSMIENGKRPLDRYSLIVALADALGVPASELAPGASAKPGAAGGPSPDLGRRASPDHIVGPAQWCTDPLADMADLGRMDLHADPGRRHVLAGAVYSAAFAALPDAAWWRSQAEFPSSPLAGLQRAGPGDVLAVRQLTTAFSQIDQRLGGGHGRKALAQYLHRDAAGLLAGGFASEQVQRDMFTAVGELSYLSGWMAFDNSEHPLAQRYFRVALKLAARAGDSPLAGHILRAMAHQAIDLGFPETGLELSAASLQGRRYLSATPRERALLGVVHARALATAGQKQASARVLLKAEDDLACASNAIAEPQRAFFFTEASLAHETGRTLQACGDIHGAIGQFQRSVRTRGQAFRRTHAVTLGYLGAAQLAAGNADEACSTWGTALDVIEGAAICSGRARQTITDMRRLISPFCHRRIPAITELDERGAMYLARAS